MFAACCNAEDGPGDKHVGIILFFRGPKPVVDRIIEVINFSQRRRVSGNGCGMHAGLKNKMRRSDHVDRSMGPFP